MIQNDVCRIRIGKMYEAPETAYVERTVKPGHVFVDVGAHIGYYTTMAARLVGETGRVFAFEPNPDNFAALVQNLTPFGPYPEYSNCAASDYCGDGELSISTTNSGDHRLSEIEGREWVPVKTVTLDSVLPDTVANFLKIDVQGHELHVLRGAEQLVNRSPNLCGLIEFAPDLLRAAGTDPADVLCWFAAHGFNLFIARTGARVDAANPHKYTELKHHVNLIFTREKAI